MKEIELRIRIFGEPILRKKAKRVEKIGPEEKKIFEAMVKLMRQAGGIGLAAPQMGIDRQLMVIDIGQGLMMLANPKIIKKQGIDILEEGCLSLPDISVRVKRHKKICVRCLDLDNRTIELEANNILSRALQHEIDHLKGRLIIDYMGWRQRFFLRKKLKQIQKKDFSYK